MSLTHLIKLFAFDTDTYNFLFPFFDFCYNFICWYESCRTIFHLKLKNGLLSDSFILNMQVVLHDFLLSMFLYVVPTKVITHFNNNGKGSKVHRQEIQKLKQRTFSEVTSTFFARLKSILIHEKASSSKTNFSKNSGIIS